MKIWIIAGLINSKHSVVNRSFSSVGYTTHATVHCILSDGSLCDEDKSAIKSWTMRMDESNDMVLAETGWNELRMLGMCMYVCSCP